MFARRFHGNQEFVRTGCIRREPPRCEARAHATALLLALALGCVPDAARRGQAGRDQGGGAAARPPLDLTQDAPWPAPYGSDPLWRRAASGADFDQARLAQRESATALLEALLRGGSLGRTALASLAYASDRREVAAELCTLVLEPAPPTSSWLLGGLHEALSGPQTVEAVDPRADALCASNLRALAGRDDSSPEDRDRALGALLLLAKR